MKKNFMPKKRLLLLLVLVLIFAASVAVNAATTVKLSKSEATLTAGKTLTLKATVSDENETVTWSSNKKSVATVNKRGVVTAKKAGSVTITASVNGASAKCKITVKAASTNVTSKYKKKVTSLLDNFEGFLCYAPESFIFNNYTKTAMLCYMDFSAVEGKSVSYVKNKLSSKMKLYFGGSKSNIKFYDVSASVTDGNYPYVFRRSNGKVVYIGGDYGEDIPLGKVTKIMKSGNIYTVTYKTYLTSEYSSGKYYLGTFKIKLKKASNKYGFIISNISYIGE